MKKLTFLLALLLVTPALAQEPPALFKALQIENTAMVWCDFTLTTFALSTGKYTEVNPIARFYVDKPAIAIPTIIAMDLVVHLGLRHLYKDNKTLAWGLLILFTAVRGYIFYLNLRTLHGTT